MFKDYNNLTIVHLKSNNVSYVDKDVAYKAILHRMEVRINKQILIEIFDTIRTDDKTIQG